MDWIHELVNYAYSIADRIAHRQDDDYRSAAHYALVRALQTFDSNEGTDFHTYAGACIRNSCLMVRRRQKRVRPLRDWHIETLADQSSDVYERIDKMRQRCIAQAICAGMSELAMCKAFGVSRREMRVIAEEARTELLDILLEAREESLAQQSKIMEMRREWKS